MTIITCAGVDVYAIYIIILQVVTQYITSEKFIVLVRY